MAPNVEYVSNRQGLIVAEDPSPQPSIFPYAAASTSSSASVGSMPAGDGIARDQRRTKDAERQVRFRSGSTLPEENRFRPGSQEFRNAWEERVRVCTRGDTRGDSDGTGHVEIEMLYSPPESRRWNGGRGAGMGQTTS